MATSHICHVDCKLIVEDGRKAHMMYAVEPSSAAGRYQWELNREILNAGRRAWRASGQGQSRECRLWDYGRSMGHRIGLRATRRFHESVGSRWSDAHTLRTFNTWTPEEAA